MRSVLAAVALVAVACGGGESGTSDAAQPAESAAAQPAAPMAAPTTGTVHDVQMLLTPDGKYVFQPADLTIKVGDRVRWTNVSGGPHNVAFYADKIPTGAKEFLNAGMTEKIGELSGKLLIQPNDTYEISFAGAPTGEYDYYCTPHEMLGMKAKLTVTQ